jgi:hypothetical protein
MKIMVALLGLVLTNVGGALAAGAAEPAPALVTVELFTSQGCSSCPVADRLLGELAERPDVLALSLSVDYWDYLGWRDTLARPENTKRQYAYAKALRTYQPYTPQIVIDGRIDVVGNNKSKVKGAIEEREKRRAAPLSIDFEPAPDTVTVVLGAGPAAEATVWLVRYAERVTVTVEHGENQGQSLTYTDAVQSMTPIGLWTGAPARFVLPRQDLLGTGQGKAPQRLAIIVQTENTGPILGAAKLPLD